MEKKWNAKRIVALGAVILLVLMYVITLLAALFDATESGMLFRVCVICTVVVPLFAWIYIGLYGKLTGKKTIADLNLMQDVEGAAENSTEATEEK